jgi:hypothetical protein
MTNTTNNTISGWDHDQTLVQFCKDNGPKLWGATSSFAITTFKVSAGLLKALCNFLKEAYENLSKDKGADRKENQHQALVQFCKDNNPKLWGATANFAITTFRFLAGFLKALYNSCKELYNSCKELCNSFSVYVGEATNMNKLMKNCTPTPFNNSDRYTDSCTRW